MAAGSSGSNEDVYYSYDGFIPVKEELARRIPITAVLAIGAAVLWLLLGIPIGIISGVRRRSVADRAAMIFAIIGVSMPIFWLAQLLLYTFWYKLELLPESGIPIGYNGWGGALRAALEGRFILPWVSLAYINAAFYARMVRGNLIETMNEDYIRTARAKGLSERRVIYKHGLRGALTPVVTMLGLDIGLLLGGAFITETVFGLPGIGQKAVQAISTNDFPTVMGVTILGRVHHRGREPGRRRGVRVRGPEGEVHLGGATAAGGEGPQGPFPDRRRPRQGRRRRELLPGGRRDPRDRGGVGLRARA